MKVVIKYLKKNFGNFPILNLCNMVIESGKITGLLGSNGSGKSTFLKILAGLDKEYTGEIYYDNKSYYHNNNSLNDEILKDVTLVFQRPMLLKRSVYKNIEYPLLIRKVPKDERKKLVNYYIDIFKLNSLRNKNALVLSGGESQKVALARAMIINPKLLLLDEPLSGVDYDSNIFIESVISDFSKKTGCTIVFVTHSRVQANNVCDNIVYFNKERDGSVNGVFESY